MIFTALGEENLKGCLSRISLGKLRTYKLFDRIKTRLHLGKLNQDALRRCSPKVYARLSDTDDDLATDLSQAILVSHLDLIVAVLDFLGVPHQDGFFDKDADVAKYLTTGWQQRAYDEFQTRFPAPVIVFYVNHLAHEVTPGAEIFRATPAAGKADA
ncbi:MAG: hypothetical protein R2762_03315 [Bryobacteraceae bacterium]